MFSVSKCSVSLCIQFCQIVTAFPGGFDTVGLEINPVSLHKGEK